MTSKPRNPDWTRDEIVLALELYQQTGGNPTGSDYEAVDALSDLLNKLHRLRGQCGSPTLRNRNGVYLKLMDLRSSDPAYTQQGKVGMKAGNKLEKEVWAEFAGRSADLVEVATLIRATVTAAKESMAGKLPNDEPYEGEEGGIVMRLHRRYERDAKLIREKRKAALAAGPLRCEVCKFDFHDEFGAWGSGYIEVHHTKPVHLLVADTKTKLADLALLCANCHRMAHRKRTPLTIEELKALRS